MSVMFAFIATKTTPDVALPTQARIQSDFNRRVANSFRAQGGGKLVVGDLKFRPNGNAIPNHLLCNGAAVSRLSFPELFRFLGTSEGAGDGVTTFNLPNYLGAPIEVPATAPVQTVSDSGTVSSGVPVTDQAGTPIAEPTAPGTTGGTEDGNIVSGGISKLARPKLPEQDVNNFEPLVP